MCVYNGVFLFRDLFLYCFDLLLYYLRSGGVVLIDDVVRYRLLYHTRCALLLRASGIAFFLIFFGLCGHFSSPLALIVI